MGKGHCRRFRREYDPEVPEPPDGTELMRCFNQEMARLGKGCCGPARNIKGFGFLTGRNNSFNDHPCHELERNQEYTASERSKIPAHCFVDGMFMVHTKDISYDEATTQRV